MNFALAIMIRFSLRYSTASLLFALLLFGCASPPPVIPLQLVDERPAAEREGFPYPNSTFSYTMHGDRSLGVDRLQLLQVRLVERFGPKLAGKTIRLQKFFVLEATLRDSFVRDASGKSVPNTGPYEPKLIAEIIVLIDQHFFGYSELKLPQNSGATASALAKVTNELLDVMIRDMARHLGSAKNDG